MALEEVKLETPKLTEFLEKVEKWKADCDIGERAIYRGHTDANWILIAKLFRDPGAKPENKNSDDPQEIEKQLVGEHLPMKEAHGIEHRLFHDFSRYLYAFRPDLACAFPGEDKNSNIRAVQEWRQLALAQHYGVPTRFLDFTTNMLVALFFALEGPAAQRTTTKGEKVEQDSAVWGIEVPNRLKVWQVWGKKKDNMISWLSPLEFAEEESNPPIDHFVNTAFVPEHIDERMRAQGSIFMCEPRGKKHNWQLHMKLQKKEIPPLKVYIPADFRRPLLKQLDSVGINRATMFPDLEGAAKYLEWAVYQGKKHYTKK